MAEKSRKNSNIYHNGKKSHPVFRQRLTIGQKAADRIAHLAGSWAFIFSFIFFMAVWIVMNVWLLRYQSFDPYPFILLNLFLSTLAALQGPVILMAQNRQAERDRVYARYDYIVNRKAEREIQRLQKDVTIIKLFTEKFKR